METPITATVNPNLSSYSDSPYEVTQSTSGMNTPVDPFNKPLEGGDVKALYLASAHVISNWYELGLQLNFCEQDLDNIKADHISVGMGKCYLMMLSAAVERQLIRTPADLHKAMKVQRLNSDALRFQKQLNATTPELNQKSSLEPEAIGNVVKVHMTRAIGSNWFFVGVSLGVSVSKLQEIEVDCNDCQEKSAQMLREWLGMRGSQASIAELKHALTSIKLPALANKIETACQRYTSPASGVPAPLAIKYASDDPIQDTRSLAELPPTKTVLFNQSMDDVRDLKEQLVKTKAMAQFACDAVKQIIQHVNLPTDVVENIMEGLAVQKA